MIECDWIEKETNIDEIDALLKDGYEIEVESQDGWVGVNFFIDKGLWNEYVLTVEDGKIVRCNENHLFETPNGWKKAFAMEEADECVVMTIDGWKKCKVEKTGKQIPIVDINVNHQNHRYYTNGISSHNTGVGKSLFMCHMAAASISQGFNVLYITMEMAEERIAERIDANLLNITLDDLHVIPREDYERKFNTLRTKVQGKLIIKEYPTASAHSGHFRSLLNELRLKKNFSPDIVFIDYLNICCSSRMKMGSSINSYTYIKAIAEELRGLAVEFSVPIVSATQTTRSGFSNTDLDLTDTSECVYVEEKVELLDGTLKKMKDLVPGDQILSQDEYKTTMFVHHKKPKECVKITLKSGKTIIVSKDHVFPTKNGRKSLHTGLIIGDFLNSK